MHTERLRQVHGRIQELFKSGKGSLEAWQAIIDELGAAISELESRPQTHVNTSVIRPSPFWKQWPDTLGYAEAPWIRVDGIVVVKLLGKNVYYAKRPGGGNGQFITDTKNRKKFWKHAETAMLYRDRDHPSNDIETWEQKDNASAGPTRTDTQVS